MTSTAVRMPTATSHATRRFMSHTVADVGDLAAPSASMGSTRGAPRPPVPSADQACGSSARNRGSRAAVLVRGSDSLIAPSRMAEPTSVALEAAPAIPSDDAIARAARFTREPFVLEGEDAAAQLARGSARRGALDAALEELEAGAQVPSVAWRQRWSLLLGLDRLLCQEEPHLADGTVLSAHQVDALSGTLTALLAESGNGSSANGARPDSDVAPLASVGIPGEEDLEDDDEPEEPRDWEDDGAAEAADADQLPDAPEDPNAGKRFWFEHATGAGKTVAALGF